jgi:hypothetical protein
LHPPAVVAVCISECPTKEDYYKFFCKDPSDQENANNDVTTGYKLVAQYRCMYQIATKDYVNRCLPDMNTEDALAGAQAASGGSCDTQYKAANSGKGWFNNFLSDVLTLQGYIFGFGIGFSTGVAFLYLYFLRIPGLLFFIIWAAVLSILVVMLIGSILVLTLADSWSQDGEHSDPEVATMRVFGYFGLACTAIYLCLVLVMRKRIQLAIGIVKQAAKALATMPALLALPVLQAIGLLVFIIPWIIYVLFLASSGTITAATGTYENSSGQDITYSYREFTYTTNTKYAFLYMIFCYFWTSEFILAFGQLAIALSFTGWYFTRDKSGVGNGTVFWVSDLCPGVIHRRCFVTSLLSHIQAIRTTIVHHLGTVAHGSLIIAIIKTIRTVIAYIQNKAKKMHNKPMEYLMMCLQCFMWCLEKIMKFINKHAYILTAIYGFSFCKSARKAFWLLLRNILRVAAVNMLSTFLLMMGRILIPVLTTFICYLAIAYGTNNSLVSGIIAPLVLCFLLSYWIACMFLEIFGMGIETILFCFIADEEMFSLEERFASGELMTTIQQTAQQAASLKIAPESKDAKVVQVRAVVTTFDCRGC